MLWQPAVMCCVLAACMTLGMTGNALLLRDEWSLIKRLLERSVPHKAYGTWVHMVRLVAALMICLLDAAVLRWMKSFYLDLDSERLS